MKVISRTAVITYATTSCVLLVVLGYAAGYFFLCGRCVRPLLCIAEYCSSAWLSLELV